MRKIHSEYKGITIYEAETIVEQTQQKLIHLVAPLANGKRLVANDEAEMQKLIDELTPWVLYDPHSKPDRFRDKHGNATNDIRDAQTYPTKDAADADKGIEYEPRPLSDFWPPKKNP